MKLSDELREAVRYEQETLAPDEEWNAMVLRAADHIDALEKRVAELEAEVERWSERDSAWKYRNRVLEGKVSDARQRVAELELHVECLKQCVRGDHGAMMPSAEDERGLPVPPWKCEECGWTEDDRDFV